MSEIKYLTIHHTAGNKTDTYQQVKDLHISEGDVDIAYHRFIDWNGKVYQGRPDSIESAATLGLNHVSQAICLAGNFDKYMPSCMQIDALVQTLAIRCKELGLKADCIIGHRDAFKYSNTVKYTTDCPGNFLYNLLPVIRGRVARYL